MSTFNSLSQTDRLKAKTSELEIKLTAQIEDLKARVEANININSCRAKSSDLYVDVAVLKSSHKYVLWILGLFAIMALSFVFGLSIPTFLRSLR